MDGGPRQILGLSQHGDSNDKDQQRRVLSSMVILIEGDTGIHSLLLRSTYIRRRLPPMCKGPPHLAFPFFTACTVLVVLFRTDHLCPSSPSPSLPLSLSLSESLRVSALTYTLKGRNYKSTN
jgi:hypothetical protein